MKNLKNLKQLAYFGIPLIALFYFILFFGDFTVVYTGGERYIHTADDHMITMRVAENFSNYRLPYFNKNEAVAASTSLFWPILLGSSIFVITKSLAMVVVLNILISSLITAVTIIISSFIFTDTKKRMICCVIVATSSPILLYGATGWEHIPQMFLITAGFLLILKQSETKLHISNLAFATISLSFIFRPDSAPIIAVVAATWFAQTTKENFKGKLLYAICLTMIPVAYLFLMHFYYSDFVPNTAHLKSLGFLESLKIGIIYIINPLKSSLAPYLIITLLIFKPKNPGAKLFVYASTLYLFYVVVIGGDVFSGGRFFLLLTPILYTITIVEIFRRLENIEIGSLISQKVILFYFLIINTAILSPAIIGNIFRDQGLHKHTAYVEQIKIAVWAKKNINPDIGSIGLHYLGIGYHLPDFHVVDFLGKAESHIAKGAVKYGPVGHNKWDYNHAFENYNIAIVPIHESTVNRVIQEGYKRIEKDFVFWEDCARHMEELGKYTYYPPKFFNNGVYGAYVRNDIKIAGVDSSNLSIVSALGE